MATFDYPYRKSINITAWVLQIIVCLILLAASAYVMSIVNDDEYNQYLDGYTGLFTYVLVFFRIPAYPPSPSRREVDGINK